MTQEATAARESAVERTPVDDPTAPLASMGDWERELPELAARYAAGAPFPHLVLDTVLDAATLRAAIGEFPSVESAGWLDYRHHNELKWGNRHSETWGPTLQGIARALLSPRFVEFLETLTGVDDLLPDRSMDGGGLHQTLRGGHLNVHADFTAHHSVPGWRRRINVLLYLNADWDPAWGGDLELWSRDMGAKVTSIAPVGNRMLVFTTDESSFHGHPEPLRCPPGTARRSLALYYFTRDDAVVARSTNYRPRPGDGARGLFVHLDRVVLRGYDLLKRRLGWSDERLRRLRRGSPPSA